MLSLQILTTAVAAATLASAHTVITYPGWRGNNLITNEEFPYGMQWMYPCGGLNKITNRTYWPTTGGAIAFQPGWFQGHATAFVYINLGFGTDGPHGGPQNMSNVMVPPFQLIGPSKNPYPGTVCLPQVPLPVNASVKAGDNATIQVVELAIHGAALFSVSHFLVFSLSIRCFVASGVSMPLARRLFGACSERRRRSIGIRHRPAPISRHRSSAWH